MCVFKMSLWEKKLIRWVLGTCLSIEGTREVQRDLVAQSLSPSPVCFTHPDLAECSNPLPPLRPVMEVPCDKPFSEEQARLYLRDIILGLEYCE